MRATLRPNLSASPRDGQTLSVEMQFTALQRTDQRRAIFAGIGTVTEARQSGIPSKELSRHIAHELNNGLVAVRGFAQMIERSQGVTEEIRECAKEILEAASPHPVALGSAARHDSSSVASVRKPIRYPHQFPRRHHPRQARALIVEDDEAIAEVLCYYIQDHFSTTLVPIPRRRHERNREGRLRPHHQRFADAADLGACRFSPRPPTPAENTGDLSFQAWYRDSPEAKQAMELGAAGSSKNLQFDWNCVKEILEKFGAR